MNKLHSKIEFWNAVNKLDYGKILLWTVVVSNDIMSMKNGIISQVSNSIWHCMLWCRYHELL